MKRVFDGALQFRSAKAFVGKESVPEHSVCLWKCVADLALFSSDTDDGRVKLEYEYEAPTGTIFIPYVGTAEAIDEIPQRTLVRLLLARWFSPHVDVPERCYLQISGWYD